MTHPSEEEVRALLRARYTADVPPPCRVCGRGLRVQSAGGGNATVWGCDGLEPDPEHEGRLRRAPGYDPSSDHYERSRWTQFRGGDSDVLAMLDALESQQRAYLALSERLGATFPLTTALDDALEHGSRNEIILAAESLVGAMIPLRAALTGDKQGGDDGK